MVDLAALTSALNQQYAPVISDQLNNEVVLLRWLRKVMDEGKNIAWDAKLASNHNAGSYADGATITGGTGTTTRTPAILQWKLYKAEFSVSGLTMAVARGWGPEQLANIFGEEVAAATRDLMVSVGQGIYSDGTGNTNLDYDGLQAIVNDSGSYAGISRTTYAKWRGNVYANGGTGRPLSKALLDQAERGVYEASGMLVDKIITTPAIVTTYENLFDSIKRQPSDGARYEIGNRDVTYKGIPVERDVNCPAGMLFMLCSNSCEFVQLQPVAQVDGVDILAGNQALTDPQGNIGIQAAIELLGRTGDKVDAFIKLYANMRCRHPNRCALIKDLS